MSGRFTGPDVVDNYNSEASMKANAFAPGPDDLYLSLFRYELVRRLPRPLVTPSSPDLMSGSALSSTNTQKFYRPAQGVCFSLIQKKTCADYAPRG